MSLEGGGVVLLAPVAGAAALAAGAVFAGGVCLVQAGRGVVAVANRVDEAIRAHAARQAAINRLCAEYEERIIQAAGQGIGVPTAEAAARTALLKRLSARKRQARKPLPPSPMPPTDWGVESEPLSGGLRIHTHTSLDKWEQATEQLMGHVEAQLKSVDGEEWVGLLGVGDVRGELTEIQEAFRAPDHNLHDLQRQLKAMNAEIIYRTNRARDRHQERAQTAGILEEAGELLAAKAGQLREEPELGAAVLVAEDLLAQADRSLTDGDFAGARELAAIAVDYMGQLSSSVDRMRRDNFSVAIEALREYAKGFNFPPDDPAAAALKGLIDQAQGYLDDGSFDGCWKSLRVAQSEADRLAQQVAERSKEVYRDRAIELARDVLQEMGYESREVNIAPDGTGKFEAIRPDGAAFRVTLTSDGLLRYKGEGFGDIRCEHEAARFFEKLEERGMVVDVQSELSVRSAANRMREVLLRQGYSMIEERVEPNGQGIVLAASGKGKTGELEVDADGNVNVHGDLAEESSRGEDEAGQYELDLEQAQALAAQRQYWETRRRMVESRRLRTSR